MEEEIKVHIILDASQEHFPIAHTCFQSIEFPLYETYGVFEQKLLTALKTKDNFSLA